MIKFIVVIHAYLLVIGILPSSCLPATDDVRLSRLATSAWELHLQQLRWLHYWEGEKLPDEYVRGGEIAITFFGADDGDSVGFCNRLTGFCSLYLELDGIMTRAAGWRLRPACDDACQAATFRQERISAFERFPLQHPSQSSTPSSSTKYFDPVKPISENTAPPPDPPDYDQKLTLKMRLPSSDGDAGTREVPPDLEQLREWARNEAQSYLASGCTDRVRVGIPFNYPKYESIYVSFKRSESCGNVVVLLNHYRDAWVKSLDIYDQRAVERISALIDGNSIDKFHVTRSQPSR